MADEIAEMGYDSLNEPPLLTVRFWAVEWFKSENGEAVRHGHSLSWNIHQQASLEAQE